MSLKEKFLVATTVSMISASLLSAAHFFFVLKEYKQFTPAELGYNASEISACEWGESTFLIFSENVGNLIYYTHIFPLVISLFIGVFVLFNNAKQRKNIVFFILTLLFSLWAYFDLILWASPSQEDVMFFWSAIVPTEMFLYLFAIYLVYLFSRPHDMTIGDKIAGVVIALPTILLMPTALTVIGLSPDCDEGALEGPVIHYMYIAEIFFIIFAGYLTLTARRYVKNVFDLKKAYTIGAATVLFLTFFTLGNLTLMFSLGPNYEQYKLFGMPLFAAIVTYAFVHLRAFGVKVILTQILVTIMWILLFSIVLLQSMATARPIIILTLIAFSIVAVQLVRSIRKEIEQRKNIEELAQYLELANTRLQELDKLKSEFVSIASHQLRSPLTAVRGYASMLTDGSFGVLPEKAKNAVSRIAEASRLMSLSVEDYLNVSRIQAGRMKYELSNFNILKIVSTVVDATHTSAERKGLSLTFTNKVTGDSVVHADEGKVNQIIYNLIDNSIKYTKEGDIRVMLEERDDKICVLVSDTGAGLKKEELKVIFEKFQRAHNANKHNVTGTGLGLYIARKMARDMGGDVTASSPGPELGSTFLFTIPKG